MTQRNEDGVGLVCVLLLFASLALGTIKCAAAPEPASGPVDATPEQEPAKLCDLDQCVGLEQALSQQGWDTWQSVMCNGSTGECGFSCRSNRGHAACDAIGAVCDRNGECTLPEEE